jgi:hypothetical protein
MALMKRHIVVAVSRKAQPVFGLAEHACAFGTAICEFANFHQFLILASALLIGSMAMVMLGKMLELLFSFVEAEI